jgi:hypothetical protein
MTFGPPKPTIFESAANKPDPENYPLATRVQQALRTGVIGSYSNFAIAVTVLYHFPRTKKRRIQKKCRSMGSAWWWKYSELEIR